MKQSVSTPNRNTALYIRIGSAVLALLTLCRGIWNLSSLEAPRFFISGNSGLFGLYSFSAVVLNALAMLLSAIIFGIIVKTGMPFSKRLSKWTAVAGIVMLCALIVPSVIGTFASAYDDSSMPPLVFLGQMLQIGFDMIFESFLLLMLAFVMHFGAMLRGQQENTPDENATT